ncbi:MAG: protein BatD [Planctomycetes bacterium]|nr:protein BatD [Planctomycetota bacterium]
MNAILRGALGALFALCALLALSPGAAAQGASGGASLRAYLTSGVVRLGDRVALVVTVENARSSELGTLPSVKGLGIGPVQPPAEQRSIVFLGARRQESVTRTWTIPLRPQQTGQYAIPGFDMLVDGVARRTNELSLNVVRDLKGEELGYLEVRTSTPKVVVGQPFTIEVLFGFDLAITGTTDYANLSLAWWASLPGLLENATPPPDPARARVQVVVNDREMVEVEQLPNRSYRGREFLQLRLVRSFTPTREGRIELPTSHFEFGRTVQSQDFFRTRREKGETYFVRAAEVALDVIGLPEQGRPLEFSGAIGQIVARADATPRDVDAGDSIKFKVEWTGAGNLEFFTAPDPARLDTFRDFRVYGKSEERSLDRRVVTYDLSPISSAVTEIPALPLSVFDPVSGRYGSVSTEPLSVRVRALEGASGMSVDDRERFRSDILDVEAGPGAPAPDEPLGADLIAGLAALVAAAWLALRIAVRRNGDPAAPAARARRRARKELAASLLRADVARAQLELVHRFVAARTNRRAEAWVGVRVGGAGAELDNIVAELEREVWGGSGTPLPRQRILAAADVAIGGGL